MSHRQTADLIRLAAVTAALSVASACGTAPRLVLTQQVEARRLAADLQVQFTRAADAANRAVMAVTDEGSTDAVGEAKAARERAEQDINALRPILQDLAYPGEINSLAHFEEQFAEYRKLDDEILEAAVENTNMKAQRLSFTSAREASDAFRKALQPLSQNTAPRDRWHVEALVAQATTAVLDIQVLHARHIAESNDAVMTTMEEQMAASDAAARKSLTELKGLAGRRSAQALADATAALDRFKAVNAEIVLLSRRNTNVRSLALTLGQKRTLTQKCEAALQELSDQLSRHEFKATR